MRILVDPVDYQLSNKGNIAVLQAAVQRVGALWPHATITVLAQGSQRPRLYVRNCEHISPYPGRSTRGHPQLARVLDFVPTPAFRALMEMREAIRQRRADIRLGQQPLDLDAWRLSIERMPFSEVDDGLDLVVVAGAQHLADSVKPAALSMLRRLETAIQCGVPTVMVGQGIGPVEDAELTALARRVLPRVDLVLIRERQFAPQLLGAFGVQPQRMIMTGDDAVEMAYQARGDQLGRAIGIGMRMTYYSEIDQNDLAVTRTAVLEAARQYAARLFSIPISHHDAELDDQVIQQLLPGQILKQKGLHAFDSPLDIIHLVGRSRLVVTAAFHPAVFALAQGIPAICLAKSEHYANKFIGLADLFGPGCQVVFMDDANVGARLSSAIDSAWRSADQLRPSLLEAAQRQIEWGHAGYQRIFELVSARQHSAEFARAR